MIVGISSRPEEIVVNPMKEKKLSNVRSVLSDAAITLVPPRLINLEFALVFIDDDELVEITPKNIRIRKAILNETDRKSPRRR